VILVCEFADASDFSAGYFFAVFVSVLTKYDPKLIPFGYKNKGKQYEIAIHLPSGFSKYRQYYCSARSAS
jgi:hypothetical protein